MRLTDSMHQGNDSEHLTSSSAHQVRPYVSDQQQSLEWNVLNPIPATERKPASRRQENTEPVFFFMNVRVEYNPLHMTKRAIHMGALSKHPITSISRGHADLELLFWTLLLQGEPIRALMMIIIIMIGDEHSELRKLNSNTGRLKTWLSALNKAVTTPTQPGPDPVAYGNRRSERLIRRRKGLVETRERTHGMGLVFTDLHLPALLSIGRAIRAEVGCASQQAFAICCPGPKFHPWGFFPRGRPPQRTGNLVSLDKALLSGSRIISSHPDATET